MCRSMCMSGLSTDWFYCWSLHCLFHLISMCTFKCIHSSPHSLVILHKFLLYHNLLWHRNQMPEINYPRTAIFLLYSLTHPPYRDQIVVHIRRPEDTPLNSHRRLIWCPFILDDNEENQDDTSQTLALLHEDRVWVFYTEMSPDASLVAVITKYNWSWQVFGYKPRYWANEKLVMMALDEKSEDHSYYCSSRAEHECLHKISWQSIHLEPEMSTT